MFSKMIFSFVDILETVFDLLEVLPQLNGIFSHFSRFSIILHHIQDQRAQTFNIPFLEASSCNVLEPYPET